MTANLPPGPSTRFGGLGMVRRFRSDPLAVIDDLRAYGDIASWRMGPIRACAAMHPELIRQVLIGEQKKFHKEPRILQLFRQVDGEGLVISQGDLWLRHRRLVQKAFSAERLRGYARVMGEQTAALTAGWGDGTQLEACGSMTRLTLEIIARAFFNLEVGDRADQLGAAVQTLSYSITREASSPFWAPRWWPTPKNRAKWQAIDTLHAFIAETIRQRRAEGEGNTQDRGDLLSMLLLATDEEGDGTRMSDQQAADEAITMFNAGHDTTASALSWIWYCLARDEAIQTRLAEEAAAVLPGRPAKFEDFGRLAYTQQVVKETLRLYPPTWSLFARVAEEPVELGGYTIPAGMWVYVFPGAVHGDARWYPEPERFDPERFTPQAEEDRHPQAWIPFGAGPHICIGKTMALMEMTLIAAQIARDYKVSLAPGQGPAVPDPQVSTRPKGGLQLAFERR